MPKSKFIAEIGGCTSSSCINKLHWLGLFSKKKPLCHFYLA